MQRLLLCLILLSISPCFGFVSTNVPISHWSYELLETIADARLIQSDLLSTKPLTRLEIARLTQEARSQLNETALSGSLYDSIVIRLEREYATELEHIKLTNHTPIIGFVKPIEDPYVRIVNSDKAPDYENQQGDNFAKGTNKRAGFTTRGQLTDWAVFYLHPELESPSTQERLDLIEGYGKVGIGPLSVEMGKDSMWWGPGYHGSMIMTTNAEPQTMIKVANDQPIVLPGILGILGPIRGVFFVSELESNRTIPKTKFTGVRVNFKPVPDFEVGLSRTIMFGGVGNAPIDFKDYAQIFWPKNVQGEENQLAGFDIAWKLPLPKYLPARSVKLYGEFAGEDSAGFHQYRPVLGIKIVDLLKQGGKTDLRFEYTKTFISRYPRVFYQHGIFQSGYTYYGRVMGHHVGTGARDVFAHLTHWFRPDLRVGLSFDRWEGMLASNRPQTDQTGIDLLWFGPKNVQCQAQYRYESNKNQTTTFNGDNHIIDVRIGFKF